MSEAPTLTWIEIPDAPFAPYFDLVDNGAVLASLFYDDKPEVAYASVPVEREDGTIEIVPGALAGLDEDEVGWCLQLTDEGKLVRVISSLDTDQIDAVKQIVEAWLEERIDRQGPWTPADDWRLWNADEETNA